MPRGAYYVDNAYNRRMGRAGMPMGSCVISKNSFGTPSFSGFSSGFTTGSSSWDTSFDSGYNGSPDKHFGSGLFSTSTPKHTEPEPKQTHSSDTRTYKDNAFNRRLDRVGLEVGTAVHHRKDGSITEEFYVDNWKNRSLDRVDLPRGSRPASGHDVTPSKTTMVSKAWTNTKEKPLIAPKPGYQEAADQKYYVESDREAAALKQEAQRLEHYRKFVKEEPYASYREKEDYDSHSSDDRKVSFDNQDSQDLIKKMKQELHDTKRTLNDTKQELDHATAQVLHLEQENKNLSGKNQTLKQENLHLQAKLRKATSASVSAKLTADISTVMDDLALMKEMMMQLPGAADRCHKMLQSMKHFVEDRKS